MKQLTEKMINAWLALDPDSLRRIRPLHNKIIEFRFTGTGLTIPLLFTQTGVSLCQVSDSPADLVLSGTPFSFLRLHLSGKTRSDDVQVTGDMELAHPLLTLFKDMAIDWEEHLSHFTGDVIATQLGNAYRRVRAATQYTKTQFTQSLSDWLHEEIQLSPPREAIADFLNDVDEFRLAVDRLTARIQQLDSDNSFFIKENPSTHTKKRDTSV